MLTRKKVSKRKILSALSKTATAQDFYKTLATAALIEVKRLDPGNRLLSGVTGGKTIIESALRVRMVQRFWGVVVLSGALGALVASIVWYVW